jgi:hypothetical protein
MQVILKYSILFIGLLAIMGCASTKPVNLLDEDLSQFENIYQYGTAKVLKDELVLESTKNWFFTTKKAYSNFILTAEVLLPDVTEYSNSGILFRAQVRKTDKGQVAIGYQAEVDPSPRKWSGGFYDQGRRKWLHPIHPERSEPDDKFVKNFTPIWTEEMANAYKHLQWNEYRIESIGNEIKIFVNGILTTHVIDNTDSKGLIGFQHHGSKQLIKTGQTDNIVKFRNIYITELE